jgi:hypothetical protein
VLVVIEVSCFVLTSWLWLMSAEQLREVNIIMWFVEGGFEWLEFFIYSSHSNATNHMIHCQLIKPQPQQLNLNLNLNLNRNVNRNDVNVNVNVNSTTPQQATQCVKTMATLAAAATASDRDATRLDPLVFLLLHLFYYINVYFRLIYSYLPQPQPQPQPKRGLNLNPPQPQLQSQRYQPQPQPQPHNKPLNTSRQWWKQQRQRQGLEMQHILSRWYFYYYIFFITLMFTLTYIAIYLNLNRNLNRNRNFATATLQPQLCNRNFATATSTTTTTTSTSTSTPQQATQRIKAAMAKGSRRDLGSTFFPY